MPNMKSFIINNKIRLLSIATLSVTLLLLCIFSFLNLKKEDHNTIITNTNNSQLTKIENQKNQIISTSLAETIAEAEIPLAKQDMLFNALFAIVKRNNPDMTDQEVSKINDFKVRSDSFSESKFNEQIYKSDFVIDSVTLRQTYKVRIYWSIYPDYITNLYGQTVLIQCPEPEKLIYEDFNCKDFGGEENIDV